MDKASGSVSIAPRRRDLVKEKVSGRRHGGQERRNLNEVVRNAIIVWRRIGRGNTGSAAAPRAADALVWHPEHASREWPHSDLSSARGLVEWLTKPAGRRGPQ
jgi:hypothetical protein